MPRCMRGLVRYARAACHTSSQWQQSLHYVSFQLPLTVTRRSLTQGSTTTKTSSSIVPRVQYDVQTAQLAKFTQQPTLPKQATLVTLDARMRRKGKLLDVARSLRSVAEKTKPTTPPLLPATTVKDDTNAAGDEDKAKSVSETNKQASPLVILVESGLTPAAARRRQRRWTAQLRRKQQKQGNGSPMRETYICVLDRHQTQAYKHYLSPATQELEVHEKVEGTSKETTTAEKAESENTVEVNTVTDNTTSVMTTLQSNIPLAATLYYGTSTEYLTVRCKALLPALANVLVVECPAWSTLSHIETAIMLQPYRHNTNNSSGGLFTPSAYKELTCVQSHDNARLTPLLPFVYVFRTGLQSCVEVKQQARDLLQCAMYDDSGMHERDCVCVLDVSDTGGNPLLPFNTSTATTSSSKEQLTTTDGKKATPVPLLSWSERVAACVAHVDDSQHTTALALPITENNGAPCESANAFLPTFLYDMHTLLQTVTKPQEVQQPSSKTAAITTSPLAATTVAAGAVSVEEATKEPSVTVDRVQTAHKQVKAVAKSTTTTVKTKEEPSTSGTQQTLRTGTPKTKQKSTATRKKRVVRRRAATQLVLPTLRITVTRDPQPMLMTTTTSEKTELSKAHSMSDKTKKNVPGLTNEQPTTLTTTNATAVIEKDVSSEYTLPLAVDRGLPLTRSLLHAMRYVLTTKDCTADNVRSYLSSLSISALLAGSRVYARVTPVATALRALLQLDTIPTTTATTTAQPNAKGESDAWLTTLPATATIVCVREKYPTENRNASQLLSRADTLIGGKDAEDEMTSAEARTVATMVMALIEANVKTGPKAVPIIGIVYRNNLHSAAQCSAVRERIARLLEKHTRYVPVALFVLMMVS